MAELGPWTDASVIVAGVDLSAYVRSASVNIAVEQQDDTAMGDTARSFAGGLNVDTISVEFNQIYDDSLVDDTLFVDQGVGSTMTVAVKPTSAATSATNPSYNGTMLLVSYVPASGSVGDQAVATAEFVTTGAKLARATS